MAPTPCTTSGIFWSMRVLRRLCAYANVCVDTEILRRGPNRKMIREKEAGRWSERCGVYPRSYPGFLMTPSPNRSAAFATLQGAERLQKCHSEGGARSMI